MPARLGRSRPASNYKRVLPFFQPAQFPPLLVITTSSLAAGEIGVPYTATLSATGGTPPYTWSLFSGSLPSGLSLSSAGVISGTPASAAVSTFTVKVTDSLSATATATLSITITPLPFPQGTLGLTAELSLSGTWTDASAYVYQRNPVQLTRGRQNQSSTLAPAQATFTVNNSDARWSIRNPTGPWYGQLVQSSPVRFSVPSSLAGINCYLRLETDTASYASAPDSAALQITSGTLSVRVDCKITDWTGNHILAAKEGATANAWALYTNGNGTLAFNHYDSGGTIRVAQSTLPVPYFGARTAIRADYNISAQTITFYTAPTMAGAWTQLGTVTTTPATTQAAGAGQAVQIGNGQSNTLGMYGEVYEMQLLATGVTVADPVFTSQTPGVSSFADAQGNTWTLAGTAELSGRLYRFHGELNSLPKAADPSLADVYSDAAAAGPTQRMQQQQSPADSAMKRAYVRLPSNLNLAAYWPAEDVSGATQIGQAVGNHAMTNAGLTMASFTGFAGSGALPVMNGATASALVDPSSVTWTDNVVRFLLAIPAGDDTNNAVICQVKTTGTIATLQMSYGTGGSLKLAGFNAAGGTVFSTLAGPFTPSLLGGIVRVSVELLGSGPKYQFYVTSATGAIGQGVLPTSYAGSVGAVTAVSFGGGLVGSAMGHFSVQGVSDSSADLIGPMMAWNGETAGARFARLCGEEGIACRITGPPDLSQPMGFQTQQTVLALLQEIETTDQGLMTEPRQVLGLGYITQRALCQQPPLATASFTGAQLAAPFTPASDFQLLVNDVTMNASDGSTARQVLTTGSMSVNLPTASPPGAGRYDTSVTVNPQYDSTLNLLAGWYLNVRSTDDDRYPVIPFDMARSETPNTIPLLDVGNYLQLTNTPAWVPPGPVKQLVAGYTETLGPFGIWTTQLNGIPEVPYETAILNDPVYGHLDTAGSQLNTGVNTVATSWSVATTAGPLWTTSAGDFPFDWKIAGEQVTVTNITGASSPQTATVTRSVNGVVKAHNAGEAISLAHPMILAL